MNDRSIQDQLCNIRCVLENEGYAELGQQCVDAINRIDSLEAAIREAEALLNPPNFDRSINLIEVMEVLQAALPSEPEPELCPVCEGTRNTVAERFGRWFRSRCCNTGCGWETALYRTEAQAREAWNKRHD